jgi:hypothetical protein
MYQFLKPILFQFDPEKIHHFVTSVLKTGNKIWGVKKLVKSSFQINDPRLEREVFGLKFKNPVGLAASRLWALDLLRWERLRPCLSQAMRSRGCSVCRKIRP